MSKKNERNGEINSLPSYLLGLWQNLYTWYEGRRMHLVQKSINISSKFSLNFLILGFFNQKSHLFSSFAIKNTCYQINTKKALLKDFQLFFQFQLGKTYVIFIFKSICFPSFFFYYYLFFSSVLQRVVYMIDFRSVL